MNYIRSSTRRRALGKGKNFKGEGVENGRDEVNRRQMEQTKAFMNIQKRWLQRVIKTTLIILGIGVFGCTITGALLLAQSETCRYPRHRYCETFTYRMDLKYPMPTPPRALVTDSGKVTHLTGGQIRTLNISQEYGTYRIVADDDESLSEVRFEVCNRAREKYSLTRMTQLTAKNVEFSKLGMPPEWYTDVSLHTQSCGSQRDCSGSVGCQRADVTVYVPTTCMFEDTRLHVQVNKGNVDVYNLTSNFDQMTFYNDNGIVHADQLSGLRVNLNTSYGEVRANEVSAHLLFLQARTAGGVVQGNNLTIYSADNTSSCNTSYYYREGFPERPEYLLSEVLCDQQEGTLTVDTRGEDLLVVDLDRFAGGSVSHINKLGKTHLKLMACYDFSGTFDLQSDLIEIVQYLPPQRLLVTNETTIYGDPVLELEAPRSWFRDYKTSTSTRRTGEICRFGSGAEHMPAGFVPGNMTLSAKSIDTGLIRLEILEPELVTEESAAARGGLAPAVVLVAAALTAVWSALA